MEEQDEELFSVICINCNQQLFKFSKNILEKEGQVVLQCPKCKDDTKITYDSISGIAIGKY
jgi:RNase P subunit RPR2